MEEEILLPAPEVINQNRGLIRNRENRLGPWVLKLLGADAAELFRVERKRANCFQAVRLYFEENRQPEFMGPAEFVAYLQEEFVQLGAQDPVHADDVMVVWSRSLMELPVGEIDFARLRPEIPGYPFGLVIEHAFVWLEDGWVFQKRNPSAQGPYEIVPVAEALAPYRERYGFEVTLHRLRPIRPMPMALD
ncbi:MAG: hypothetical protein KF865_14650 [Bdellovibrionaceae bacterium]|nr:hypothetical protein [Pseudobdellovibrionaceae bacterium]